ncbi:MAG: CapA family protein [Flammeovirgaceae bacterium]
MKKVILIIIAILLNALALFLIVFIIDYQLSREEEAIVGEYDTVGELHLAFVGDLMCHEANFETAEVGKGVYDFTPPFRLVKPFILEADMAFGNLETVFRGTENGLAYAGYPTFNTPDAYATALAHTGFDCLFTANNHAWDGGAKGVTRTLNVLAEEGLLNVGTQETKQERSTVKLFELENIKFSVLAYTESSNGKVPKALRHMLNFIDTAQIRQDIKNVKAKGAEIVIVNFHFGQEYEREPNAYQQEIVRHAIECGADIIVGEHPHVIQPIQLFKGGQHNTLDTGLVAFSMGNFYSNQMSVNNSGIILNVKLKKDEVTGKIRITNHFAIPTFIVQYKENEKTQFLIVHSSLSMQRLLPKRLRRQLPQETSLLSEGQFKKMERAFSEAEALLSASNAHIEVK